MPRFTVLLGKLPVDLDREGHVSERGKGPILEELKGLEIHDETHDPSWTRSEPPTGTNPWAVAERALKSKHHHIGYNFVLVNGKLYLTLALDRQGWASAPGYIGVVVCGDHNLNTLSAVNRKRLGQLAAYLKKNALKAGLQKFDVRLGAVGRHLEADFPIVLNEMDLIVNTPPPAEPTDKDDPYWQQYDSWHEAAVSVKQELDASNALLDTTIERCNRYLGMLREVMDSLEDDKAEIIKRIRPSTGKEL
jgi:hypothetical protein